ncbi:MAG: dTDP-4-dehydrorhamnose 3,5-epimerase [Candidatus Eremiobacteraeota bacterium]|nr:dTDP-4-dehydrorhamnose 3,5-epimerase [Candidatus Eremiobacteraeota bacterium]
MQTLDTIFTDAKVFVPDVFEDDRGFFKETYNLDRYSAAGLSDTFVQDSVSFSTRNVIRGLHYDVEMSKFVTVLRGRIWDVIADVRPGSPTYGKWQGFHLSEHNHKQLYVPAGFAHGFLALSDDVVFSYKHGAMHDPKRERAIRWNDPTLAIAWPLVGEPRLSPKDAVAPLL